MTPPFITRRFAAARIFCRIAFERDEIGELTGADGAAIGEVKNRGVAGRGLTQHFQWREAVFAHQQFHFPRIVAVREHPRVAAHHEGDSGVGAPLSCSCAFRGCARAQE
jgi:hypothetical protein